MAPVRRRTTALLLAAGLLLVGVAGLAWFLVGDDGPDGGTAAGASAATAAGAGGAAGTATTTAPASTAAEGPSATTTPSAGANGSDTSGPPAPPAPPCQNVLTNAEAAAALGATVARTESRDGFLLRTCTFWAASGRYLLVQVSRGVAASKEQYDLSRLPADRDVAGIGQAARWTRDTGLLDVLDGGARFQVGLFTAAGTAAGAAEPPPRLEAAAQAVAAHL
jgi:pyruvate/2-oxoglutarate dehydrogenase complex dihydrolipoamide acyltransferase (E2) component